MAERTGSRTEQQLADVSDRRTNVRLRELVDEMLASLRVAARRDLWTPDERRQYEAELASIMERVRFEAVWKGPTPEARETR